MFGCDQLTYWSQLAYYSWGTGAGGGDAMWEDEESWDNVVAGFVWIFKENTHKNENLRSRGNEREVLGMSLIQAANTVTKVVYMELL